MNQIHTKQNTREWSGWAHKSQQGLSHHATDVRWVSWVEALSNRSVIKLGNASSVETQPPTVNVLPLGIPLANTTRDSAVVQSVDTVVRPRA